MLCTSEFNYYNTYQSLCHNSVALMFDLHLKITSEILYCETEIDSKILVPKLTAHAQTNTHMHACMYTHGYVATHLCMCTHIHTHTHTHTEMSVAIYI